MVERPPVLLAPIHTMEPNDGPSLHPNSRCTYDLSEWWDAEQATFNTLWEARGFADIGEAVEKAMGLALHRLSDRVGNLLVFDRVSPWRLDYARDALTNEHWIRPLYDGPLPVPLPALRLHARIHAYNEVAVERVYDLTEGGVGIPVQQRYTGISLSLFDAATGDLLASERSELIAGPFTVHFGQVVQAPAPVTGTDNVPRRIQWRASQGALAAMDRREPWINRSRRREVLNEILAESSRAVIYQANSRQAALDHIRDLIQHHVREFVYIWDPYFDRDAAKDFLYEVPPGVHCRILLGSNKPTAPLEQELATLRGAPWNKVIACQHRILPLNRRPVYHDRFLITSGAAWVLGTSFNQIGTKPGVVLRLLDADRLRWLFDDAWNQIPAGEQVTQL